MTFPVIPNFASASTFTDSGEAWDGAANKSTLSLSSFPQGFLPGNPVPAEDVNALISALCNEVNELRQSASLPTYIGGATVSEATTGIFANANLSIMAGLEHHALAPIEDVRNLNYSREVLPSAILLTASAGRIAGESGYGSLMSSAQTLTDLHCLTPSAGGCLYATTALVSTTSGRLYWLSKAGVMSYTDLTWDTTQRYTRGNGMCAVSDSSGNTHVYTMFRHYGTDTLPYYRYLHVVLSSAAAYVSSDTLSISTGGSVFPAAVASVRLLAPWWGDSGSSYGFVSLGYRAAGSVVQLITHDQGTSTQSVTAPFGTTTTLVPISIRYDPWELCYFAHFWNTATNASVIWKSQGTNVHLAWTQISSITYAGPQYLSMASTNMVPVDCVHFGKFCRLTVWAGSSTAGSSQRRFSVRKSVYDGNAWVDTPIMIAPTSTGTSAVYLGVSLCKNGTRSASILRHAPTYGSAASGRYFDLWSVRI